MDTSREVFRNLDPTSRAELGGVLGWDFDHLLTSLRRFVSKNLKEPKPSSISHLPGETMILPIPGIHVLDVDGIIGFEKLIGDFKVEISPLIGNFLMGLGYEKPVFLPLLGTFPPSREPLLPHSKPSVGLVKMTGISYLNSIGGGEEGFKSNINSHLFASSGQRFFGDTITGEVGIPFTGGSSSDSDGLNVALNRPGKPEFESSEIGDGEILALKPPAGLLQGEGIISVFALESGEAGFLPILNPAEEALKSSIKSLQNILESLGVYLFVFRECLLKLRKLSFLLRAGDGVMFLLVEASALLKSGVIEVSAKVKPAFSFLKGLRIGFNAVLKGFFHLPCTDCIIAEMERAFIPPLKEWVFPPAIL